ncbi:MAG: DUF2490 domain-containing protein [Weeksellaceae bacterium]|nr:DUF2490 domain-containing protein [Weeksellaceae bacterium]
MKKVLILSSLFLIKLLFSQSNPREHISSFNMTSFTYKHDKNWQLYVELQTRGIEDFTKIDYYEAKGGIGYNIGSHQPFIGIGTYGTYRNSRFYQRETRLWLQYVYSHNIDRLKLDHRLRAEKRFYDFPQTDTKDNTERYRYRLSASLPLNNEKLGPDTFFVNAFNEIFVGPDLPTFKRNRLFSGIGYVFSGNVSSNVGYMWQCEFSSNSTRNLHFLYFALNFTFDRLKETQQSVPVAD